MPYSYAQTLVAIAKGETDKLDKSVIAYLEKHGYIKKDGESYIPTFLVMFKNNGFLIKAHSRAYSTARSRLYGLVSSI